MVCLSAPTSPLLPPPTPFPPLPVKPSSARDCEPQEDYCNALPMSNKSEIKQVIFRELLNHTAHSEGFDS